MPTIYPGQLIKPGGYSTSPGKDLFVTSLLRIWYPFNNGLHNHLPRTIQRKIHGSLNFRSYVTLFSFICPLDKGPLIG